MKVRAIKIDKELCIGCGSCASLLPNAFDFDLEEGKAEVKDTWRSASSDDLRRACEACPVRAITLEED